MPPNPGVIFVLFLGALILLAGVAFVVLSVARWYHGRVTNSTMSSVRSAPLRSRQVQIAPESVGSEPRTEPEPQPNLALQSQEPERTGSFVLNPDELAAVARMIEHKATAEKPTKASIIWAGFGVKKGESARYKRASAIYDALFIIPPEPAVKYRPLDEQARPILN